MGRFTTLSPKIPWKVRPGKPNPEDELFNQSPPKPTFLPPFAQLNKQRHRNWLKDKANKHHC